VASQDPADAQWPGNELKPVIFRYKKEIEPQKIPQFGLVAEDVEAANPDLVVRDKEGKVNTVRYHAINAMLLNEFPQSTLENGGTGSDNREAAKAD